MQILIGAVIVVAIVGWLAEHVTYILSVAAGVVVVGLVFQWLVRAGRRVGYEPGRVVITVENEVPDAPPERASLLAGEFLLAERVSASVLLRYRDSGGQSTERIVDVGTVGGRRTRGRGTYLTSLSGFCHLRKDVRTFKASRIDSAYDPRTGEQISSLGSYLLNRPDLITGDQPPPPSTARREAERRKGA